MDKPELLKRAINALRTISPRAEDQDRSEQSSLFVPGPKTGILKGITSSANQVLYGRRGTGKTMILKQVRQSGKPDNPNGEYIALHFSTFDFMRSPEISHRDPPTLRARIFFRSFLALLGERMLDVGSSILEDDGLLVRLGLRRQGKRQLLEHRLLELWHMLRYGSIVTEIDSASHVIEMQSLDEQQSEKARRLGAGLELRSDSGPAMTPPVFPKAKVSASIASSRRTYTASALSEAGTIHARRDLGMPEIRGKLRDIAEHFQAERFLIMIDEWDMLRECQAEFAHLLKACFSGLDYVAVKIAAYRYASCFNNRARGPLFRGMELQEDLFELGDLDLPADDQGTVKFFFEALYKRLAYKTPELLNLYGELKLFDYHNLINDLFRNPHVATSLVHGSHGILRDFIEVFITAASAQADGDVYRDKIQLTTARRALRDQSREIRVNLSRSDDIGGFLFERVQPYVFSKRVPFFFVTENQEEWSVPIRELVSKRALHPFEEISILAGYDVRGYWVAHGIYLDWRRGAEFGGRKQESWRDWQDIRDKILSAEVPWQDYVLPLGDGLVSQRSTRCCHACGHEFSTAERSYVLKKICPKCFGRADPPEEEDS